MTIKDDIREKLEQLKSMEGEHGFDNVWVHVLGEIREYFGTRGHHGLFEKHVRMSETKSD